MRTPGRMEWVELAPGELRIVRIFRNKKDALIEQYVTHCFIVQVLYREAVGAIRYQIWLRSRGECELCAAPITEASGHMHEKQHRGRGGEISLDNSVFICQRCHQRAHADRNPRWSEKS